MGQEPWQTALYQLENTYKWALRAVICRMLGRLEAYDESNLDWFIQACEQEVLQYDKN